MKKILSILALIIFQIVFAQSNTAIELRALIKDGANEFENYKGKYFRTGNLETTYVYHTTIGDGDFVYSFLEIPQKDRPIFAIFFGADATNEIKLARYKTLSAEYITEFNEMVKSGNYTRTIETKGDYTTTNYYDLSKKLIIVHVASTNHDTINVYGDKIKVVPRVVNLANINETVFRADVDQIIKDAATGFKTSKSDFDSEYYGIKYYKSNLSIFDTKNAAKITFEGEYFTEYNKTTHPESYNFFQGFSYSEPEGVFVYDNAARIFDDLADKLDLKKKVKSEDRKEKSENRKRTINYSLKGRNVFELIYYTSSKAVSIYIYSDLHPSDAPKYLGCMVLYYQQSGRTISAVSHFVYGDTAISQEQLYSNIIRNMRSDGKENYSKYEWMPSATGASVSQKMTDLNIKDQRYNVNTDGFSITR